MSSENERAPTVGPIMPENDDESTEPGCAVADATSGLDGLLVEEDESPDPQSPEGTTLAEDSAAFTPSLEPLTAKKSAGDPAASTPSMTPILRDDEEDASLRTKIFAGIERKDELETAATAQLRYRTSDSFLAVQKQSHMCMSHHNCCAMKARTVARAGTQNRHESSRNMIPTPRVGVTNRCLNDFNANEWRKRRQSKRRKKHKPRQTAVINWAEVWPGSDRAIARS